MDPEKETTTAGGENQADVQNQEATTVTQNGVASDQAEDATKEETGGDAPADAKTGENAE